MNNDSKTEISLILKQLKIITAKQPLKIYPSNKFVDLNFKVDPQWKKGFKNFAHSQDMTMKEVLLEAFNYYMDYRKREGNNMA